MSIISHTTIAALALVMMSLAANAHADGGRSWDGHAQDDTAHYRTVADETSLLQNAGSRVWDGKGQDDSAHYRHKVVETRDSSNLFKSARTAWPSGRTWDGLEQGDPAHFAGTHAAPATAKDCEDMPCCKRRRMTPEFCRTHMMRN